MSWRLKTREEFIAEGWSESRNETTIYPPSGAASPDIVSEMFDQKIWDNQDAINAIMNDIVDPNKEYIETEYNDYSWSKSMFIEDTPLVPLCNCKWNKHPLFCRC